jgi:asparagine synthase (glutamine-hydrolysing)
MEMAYLVEVRMLFLDYKLTEMAHQLPPSMKIPYDNNTGTLTEKYVLREAVKPFVLPELYERRKHSYMAPTVYPIGGPLYRLYAKLLTQENVVQLGLLNWKGVKEFSERAFEIKQDGDRVGRGDPRAIRSSNVICQ